MLGFRLLAALLVVSGPIAVHAAARAEPPPPPPPPRTFPAITAPDLSKAELCQVLSAADGDTISVIRNNRIEKVLLLGVDTPETQDPRKAVQFFGAEASAFLDNLVKGEEVYLVQERPGAKDKYGRTLAHVYRAPDGLWINLEIVRQGYGQVYSGEAFQDIDLFLTYQCAAREAERGLWDTSKKAEWDHQHADPPPLSDARPPLVPVPVPVSASPAAKAPEPAVEEAKVTVYVTRTGSKYHRAGCSYLSKSSISIDLREAKQRYGPCSKCGPPR